MDQKRLMIAIAISIAILLGFQLLMPPKRPVPAASDTTTSQGAGGEPAKAPASPGAPSPGAPATVASTVPKNVPRVKIQAPRVEGSISLLGGRLDDVVLRDYRETIDPKSPNVQVLEPRSDPKPYYIQFGWTPAAGTQVAVPDADTVWQASADTLAAGKPVTLTWDNGAGLSFAIEIGIDDNFMFQVHQSVRNATGAPVALYPWSRISRDYTPPVAGTYVLHEGMVGWLGDQLREEKYSSAKSDGAKNDGVAFTSTGMGGWAGITDKYWLTALVPDQKTETTAAYRYAPEGSGSYQVFFVAKEPLVAAPGGSADYTSRAFVGAKEVHLLTRYQDTQDVPQFSYAVDFGWFWFLTKPFFYAIDYLNALFHNFGIAILVFTLCVKGLFFPLANKSYRSMSKMKLLGPKIQALREQFKDDPAKQQQAMMQLYKAEKVNPASGCLPIVIQIPVFFSLYKVIYTTIEMRQAPFFGWIHDLSEVDPTNVFNLFGLLPFDPLTISPLLHLGAWPLIMGCTMFFQQKLNPPPPDPVQAKIFQFMPIIFTFMLARFPAGLVIYWSWNNLLTIAQQSLIMRRTRLAKPSLAKV